MGSRCGTDRAFAVEVFEGLKGETEDLVLLLGGGILHVLVVDGVAGDLVAVGSDPEAGFGIVLDDGAADEEGAANLVLPENGKGAPDASTAAELPLVEVAVVGQLG